MKYKKFIIKLIISLALINIIFLNYINANDESNSKTKTRYLEEYFYLGISNPLTYQLDIVTRYPFLQNNFCRIENTIINLAVTKVEESYIISYGIIPLAFIIFDLVVINLPTGYSLSKYVLPVLSFPIQISNFAFLFPIYQNNLFLSVGLDTNLYYKAFISSVKAGIRFQYKKLRLYLDTKIPFYHKGEINHNIYFGVAIGVGGDVTLFKEY